MDVSAICVVFLVFVVVKEEREEREEERGERREEKKRERSKGVSPLGFFFCFFEYNFCSPPRRGENEIRKIYMWPRIYVKYEANAQLKFIIVIPGLKNLLDSNWTISSS